MEANKENSFLDLSKLSEEQIKLLPQILKKANEDIYETSEKMLNSGLLIDEYGYDNYILLSKSNENEWVAYLKSGCNDKTELTYPEFIKLFEGGEGKEVLHVETPKNEPWNFCETPEEKCTMNYCDDNGCQNRKIHLVEPKPEIECKNELRKQIQKFSELIETIEGEIELADEPEKEYDERNVLDSIRELIEQSKKADTPKKSKVATFILGQIDKAIEKSTLEQQIEKLEADKAELLEGLQDIQDELENGDTPKVYKIEEIIQKHKQ